MAVTPKDYRSGEKIKFIKYLHQRKLISETQYNVNQDIVDDITLISTQTSIKESLLSIYYQEWNESDYEVLKEDISDDVLGYVNADICRKYNIIPYRLDATTLYIAASDPHNLSMRKAVSAAYKNCKYSLSDNIIIQSLLHVYYRNVTAVTVVAERLADDNAYKTGSADDYDKLIDEVVLDGFDYDATDVHIIANSKDLSYRLRTHHQFFPRVMLPRSLSLPFKNRLLIRAGCPFNKLKHVQDAAISVKSDRSEIPVRVSFIPTQDGYSIVLRIIRDQYTQLDKNLFSNKQWTSLIFELQYNKGLILISGPVGSGKTTFYYGVMKRLAENRLKVISIEDPIESKISHTFQMDISQEKLSFQQTMKIILRQDPDVLMIGEIREDDAVRCVSEAKLSGNMVIGTIHAQSPWDCIIKLRRLGYPENQLISQGVCILLSRLIPIICQECKVPHQLSQQEEALLKQYSELGAIKKWYHSPGCKKCHYSGVKTIKPFYDILSISPAKMAELAVDWNKMRFDTYLQIPVENLKRYLLSHAVSGECDLKTYFEFSSV